MRTWDSSTRWGEKPGKSAVRRGGALVRRADRYPARAGPDAGRRSAAGRDLSSAARRAYRNEVGRVAAGPGAGRPHHHRIHTGPTHPPRCGGGGCRLIRHLTDDASWSGWSSRKWNGSSATDCRVRHTGSRHILALGCPRRLIPFVEGVSAGMARTNPRRQSWVSTFCPFTPQRGRPTSSRGRPRRCRNSWSG